ncbi:hypothetical protein AAHC03_013044 [Spirometra sp. Aus1]
MAKPEGARSSVPSLLLVRVKQEEADPTETLGRSKVNKSGHSDQRRQVRRLTAQRERAFSESDCTSSGDEWQPPPSPTSLPISNDVRIRNLSPSTAFSVSADELNTENSVSTSIDAVSHETLTEANTSELPHPKRETEDSSYEKRTGSFEGGFRPCPDSIGQKVENLGLTVNEPRSIHVNWEPPTSPQGIIHNYKVLVKNKVTGASQKHVFSEPGQSLANLDPSTAYIISVAVRNYPLEGSGGGYGVEVSDEATTLSLDIERPTDVRAIAINSDSVRLTWRAPAYKLSDGSGYSLLIVGPDFNKSAVVGNDTLTHKFSGLQPSTDYTVYVQVSDSVMGQPRPTGSSLVRTNSAGSVNGLSAYATATSSDAVSVSWKRLQNYRVEDIRHYAVSIFGPSIDAQQLVKADEKTCTFSDLPPFTNFTVLVELIFKDDSWLSDTAEASVTTWPTVGQRVENLGLTANEPRAIYVNWEPPTSPQGIIHNYKVLVKKKGSGASQKHIFSEPGQWLVNLDPATTYIISVAVRNYPLEGRGGGYGVEVSDEAKTLSLDRELCGKQSHAPVKWPALQSTRHESNQHSWPWNVGLYTSVRGGYPYCGGTLVSPKWIVTAAHCVEMAMNCTTAPVGKLFSYKALTNATLFARIGDHDLRKTETSERDRRVQSVIVHPQYQVHSGNSEHDVALLRLEKTVAPGKEIDFICLPGRDSSDISPTECAFAGWGSVARLRTLGYQNSPVLTEGRLKIESEDFCELSTEECENEGQACLATGTGAPCFGDSGAGVYCLDAEGKWIVYGIINRGSFLCEGQYATSTKILPHAEWINSVIATSEVH